MSSGFGSAVVAPGSPGQRGRRAHRWCEHRLSPSGSPALYVLVVLHLYEVARGTMEGGKSRRCAESPEREWRQFGPGDVRRGGRGRRVGPPDPGRRREARLPLDVSVLHRLPAFPARLDGGERRGPAVRWECQLFPSHHPGRTHSLRCQRLRWSGPGARAAMRPQFPRSPEGSGLFNMDERVALMFLHLHRVRRREFCTAGGASHRVGARVRHAGRMRFPPITRTVHSGRRRAPPRPLDDPPSAL